MERGREPPPFPVRPAQLYEVGRSGSAFTTRPEAPEDTERRANRLRALWAVAMLANARGATGGLLAAACLPLLAAVPVMAWLGRRRPRQWHRERPGSFPGPR